MKFTSFFERLFVWLGQNKVLVILLGAFFLAVFAWLFFRLYRKWPVWLSELIDYTNLKEYSDYKALEKMFVYSIFFQNQKKLEWQYFWQGKIDKHDFYLGNCVANNKEWFCFVIKQPVQPMFISNISTITNLTKWPNKKIVIDGNEYNLATKEEYVLENVANSLFWTEHATKLFGEAKNWLEFTEINQVIFITDRQISSMQDAIKIITNLNTLKENI